MWERFCGWRWLQCCGLLLTLIQPSHRAWAQVDIGAGLQAQRVAQELLQQRARLAWHRLAAESRLRPAFFTTSTMDPLTIDITHTKAVIDADEATGTLDVQSTLQFKVLKGPQWELYLQAFPLEQTEVLDELGQTVSGATVFPQGYIHVAFDAPKQTGDEFTLRFNTSGKADCEPDPTFGMQFCAVGPDITFTASLQWVPGLLPLSYDSAVYQSGTMDIDIITPPGYVAVSTSDPDRVDVLEDRLVHHFIGHFPANFGGIAYAPFTSFTALSANGTPVKVHLHEGSQRFGQTWANICADVLDYLGEILGPYPYNKQDVVQAIEALGGGVGPQSATFYVASALNTDPAQPLSDNLFAHEIGHSWWGNAVRLKDYGSPWLSEGINSFTSFLFSGTRIHKAYIDYQYQWTFLGYVGSVLPGQEIPLTPLTQIHDANAYFLTTYGKGAAVMRMLQWKLGDECFMKGLNRLGLEHRFTPEGRETITVDTVKTIFEEECATDLTGFFDTWIYGVDYPTYRYAAEFGKLPNGNHSVRVRIREASGTPFHVPVEVILYKTGTQQTEVHQVEVGAEAVEQTFELDAEPAGLAVNQSSPIFGYTMTELTGDVNASNEVDGVDLVMAAWAEGGSVSNPQTMWRYINAADFNLDLKVDAADVDALVANMGKKGVIQ